MDLNSTSIHSGTGRASIQETLQRRIIDIYSVELDTLHIYRVHTIHDTTITIYSLLPQYLAITLNPLISEI